jgi:hypothetical protein
MKDDVQYHHRGLVAMEVGREARNSQTNTIKGVLKAKEGRGSLRSKSAPSLFLRILTSVEFSYRW